MKRLLTLLVLIVPLFGCANIYRLDLTRDRRVNATSARKLYSPLNKYRQAHGHYPDNLSRLKPNYIEDLPTTVAGHQFFYLKHKNSQGFSLGWYQSEQIKPFIYTTSLINQEISVCTVTRYKSIRGDVDDHHFCWLVS